MNSSIQEETAIDAYLTVQNSTYIPSSETFVHTTDRAGITKDPSSMHGHQPSLRVGHQIAAMTYSTPRAQPFISYRRLTGVVERNIRPTLYAGGYS